MIKKTMYPPQKDSPSTFLAGDVLATDNHIIVGNAAILPQTTPYPLTIGVDRTVTETVLVTEIGLNNNQLTIQRQAGALYWASGTKVARVFTANDLQTVQDNLSNVIDQTNEQSEYVEALDQRVNTLETKVGDEATGLIKGLSDEIARAKLAEQTERERAMSAESVLTSVKVNRTELPQVITNLEPSADETEVKLTITRYNASNQSTSTFTRTLPVVDNENLGVMTPEAYREITNLRSDVSSLQQQGGRFIGISFATKAALDAYVIPSTINVGDFTYVLDDETQGESTTRYIYNGSLFVFGYVINYDPVGIATTTTTGIVKSTTGVSGKVFVETDGTMSLVGWDNLLDDVGSKFELPPGGTSEQYLNGLGEWAEPTTASGAFVLRITFEASIPTATPFSVIGGTLNYSGIIPSSHVADVPASDPNVSYTVTCQNSVSTVTVENLYGIFPVTIQGAPTDVTSTNLNASYGTSGTAQASCSSSLSVIWSAQNLPSGFTINQSTGEITGSTTTIGTGTFTVTATSTAGATTSLPISYDIQPLAPSGISGEDLIADIEGETFTSTFSANQNGSTINWTTSGLPTWADVINTYVTGNVAYCIVGGVPGPDDVGNGTFTVTATNTKGSTNITKNFAVIVLYGFDLELAILNPSSRVVYPSGVNNTHFTPAAMEFGGSFNYGSWSSDNWFMPKPCMLNYDGTVAYYLDPNDYTKKLDGSASDVANTSFGGNAMMQWPKIYTKREEVSGVYKFRVCNIKLDSSYECWCNYDQNNNEIPYFYTPIYFGSIVSSRLRSISGQANGVSQTAATEITYAQANGTYWHTEVIADRYLLIDLCILISKTTDSQSAFGYGRNNSSSAVVPGTMNTRGLFWGGADSDETGVKVFGMEHPWGNLWRRTAGLIVINGSQRLKLTRGTKDGSSVSDYNITGSGYLTIGASPGGTSGGYISGTVTHAGGRMAQTASGSSSTYDPDGLWFNNSATTYAIVGGDWNDALLCGVSCVYLNYATSRASSTIGASLSCKPFLKEEM